MGQPTVLGAFARGLGQKAAAGAVMPDNSRTWWPIIREPFAGAWQRNIDQRPETLLGFSALYACVTLIASDLGKLRLRLVEQDAAGIWAERENSAFSPVLRKPNRYQNRIQFIQWWATSKLIHGNTYVLKVRDNRNVVVGLYILDPLRTKVLVAPDGSVFYDLSNDNLSGLESSVKVPASEIIHDVMNPLYHPLCGVSPISACGLAAVQGLAIQKNSTRFFQNNAQPGGILTAPSHIPDDTAERLKKHWEENFTGENVGRTAVLGDGLKYEAMSVNPVDAQLIEQLKWTAENVCSAFHVPSYMVGVGPAPSYNNIEALGQQYYTQCLQILIESIELCLDEGLGLGRGFSNAYGTEFDLSDLLRMDSATQIKTISEAIKGGIYKPDEGRKAVNLPPTEGGDQVYLQQQNFSLRALAKRDAKEDPFSTGGGAATPPTVAPEPVAEPEPEPMAEEDQKAMWQAFLHTELRAAA